MPTMEATLRSQLDTPVAKKKRAILGDLRYIPFLPEHDFDLRALGAASARARERIELMPTQAVLNVAKRSIETVPVTGAPIARAEDGSALTLTDGIHEWVWPGTAEASHSFRFDNPVGTPTGPDDLGKIVDWQGFPVYNALWDVSCAEPPLPAPKSSILVTFKAKSGKVSDLKADGSFDYYDFPLEVHNRCSLLIHTIRIRVRAGDKAATP